MSGGKSSVGLRAARAEDLKMVFCWRNDPFLVARASSQKPVTWDEHSRWFLETIRGADRRMFIVTVNGNPAGQVRFDRKDGETFVISAYLLETYTGHGFGVEAIRQGCESLFGDNSINEVVAFVRADNKPSHAAFRKAGFCSVSDKSASPPGHLKFIFSRRNHSGSDAELG